MGEEPLPVGDHLVDLGDARRHPQAAGLGHRERANRIGPERRGQQGNHCPVGMADEVRSIAEQLGEHRRLDLEVVSLQWRGLAEPRPAGDGEAPALGQLALLPPGQLRPDDVAVDEEDGRPLAQALNREHAA